MDQTLRQIGELLLGSVPTIVFLALLYAIYGVLVHRPLGKVLAERRSMTEGAAQKARADIAAAEARTAEYEQRLREARVAVFRSLEARRQRAIQGRAAALAEARARAQALVEETRKALERDKLAAQAALEKESVRLAAEIMQSVLEPAGGRP